MPVSSVLSRKGSQVSTVTPDARVAEAVTIFRDDDIGAVVVTDDGVSIAGILSERDVVHGLIDHGAAIMDFPVKDLMTKEVITCAPSDSVSALTAIMTERRIRHIPVVENGKLCGIVSIGDAVKKRLDDLQAEADAMRDYIARGS